MFKTLLKVRLAALTSSMMKANSNKNTGKGKLLLFGFLMLYVVAVIGYVFSMTFGSMAPLMSAQGLGWFYFAFTFLAAFAMMFIFSVFAAKSQLFEAKDNELLLAMPVKPRDILMSRIAILIIINVIYELAVVVPSAVQWWKINYVSPVSVIGYVLLCVSLPLTATAFSCVFGWLLSLLTARIRNKTPFTVALSVLFLVVYFFFYNKLSTGMSGLAEKGVEYAGKLSSVLPLVWQGRAVADGDILCLLISLAILLVPFAVVIWVLSANFLKTVFHKEAAVKVERTDKAIRVSGVKKALLGREIKRLLASANYIMNSGMGVIMQLIAAVALVVMKGKLGDILAEFAGHEELVAALIPGILCFFSSMVIFTAPSVSLEGKTLWLVRSLPVKSSDILEAKLHMHLAIAAPATLILSVAAIYALPFAVKYAAFIIIIPQLFMAFTALTGLMCDLKHPNLNWLSEVQAVKQSISVLLCMMFGLVGVAVPFLAVGFLAEMCPSVITLTAVCVVYAAVDMLMYRWVKTKGAMIFETL